MKKVFAVLMTLTLALALLAGCGNTATEEPAQEETAETAEAVETEETAAEFDADTAILVVSFGTSYNESRDATIGATEQAIQEAFPNYEVRRAFTSQIIIDKLAERDGLEIDNVTEALDRAAADGIQNLIVQPTHLMDGYEYNDLKNELADYEDTFSQIVLGQPLLTSDDDFEAVISAITADTASYDDGQTAVVFMGHGTEADSNAVYAKRGAGAPDGGGRRPCQQRHGRRRGRFLEVHPHRQRL